MVLDQRSQQYIEESKEDIHINDEDPTYLEFWNKQIEFIQRIQLNVSSLIDILRNVCVDKLSKLLDRLTKTFPQLLLFSRQGGAIIEEDLRNYKSGLGMKYLSPYVSDPIIQKEIESVFEKVQFDDSVDYDMNYFPSNPIAIMPRLRLVVAQEIAAMPVTSEKIEGVFSQLKRLPTNMTLGVRIRVLIAKNNAHLFDFDPVTHNSLISKSAKFARLRATGVVNATAYTKSRSIRAMNRYSIPVIRTSPNTVTERQNLNNAVPIIAAVPEQDQENIVANEIKSIGNTHPVTDGANNMPDDDEIDLKEFLLDKDVEEDASNTDEEDNLRQPLDRIDLVAESDRHSVKSFKTIKPPKFGPLLVSKERHCFPECFPQDQEPLLDDPYDALMEEKLDFLSAAFEYELLDKDMLTVQSLEDAQIIDWNCAICRQDFLNSEEFRLHRKFCSSYIEENKIKEIRRQDCLQSDNESNVMDGTRDNEFLLVNKKRYWTLQETNCLKEAVNEHGKNWSIILRDAKFNLILYRRSGVDLKDKWRNLERQGATSLQNEKNCLEDSRQANPNINVLDPQIQHDLQSEEPGVVINDNDLGDGQLEPINDPYYNVDSTNRACKKCGKEYTRLYNARIHALDCGRAKSKLFTCDICRQTFSRKDNLNRHIKTQHLRTSTN
jgi:hypothetical protein